MISTSLNSLILQITSDAVCGRREQAFETLEFICKQRESDRKLFSDFIEAYEKANHHCNPNILELTLKLYKTVGQRYVNLALPYLICIKSLCFKPNQILTMLEAISSFDAIDEYCKRQSPLLLSYLNGELEKVRIFLAFGFDANIEYKCMTVMNSVEIDGEKECFGYELHSKPQFVGMTLEQVIRIENPDLLLSKKLAPTGSC
jgi:hypothetical protein